MDKNKKIAIAVIIAVVIVVAIIVFLLMKNTKAIYTVSFNTDGGEIVSSKQVKDGENVSEPTNPSKEGYKFLGWYLGDEIFDFTTPIKENITLEAKWEKIDETVYTITLENDGEKIILKTNEQGILEEPETPTKEGYKFLGWYIENEKVDFSKPFTEDKTIVAKWEKEEKKVEEKENKPSTNQPENEKPTTPSNPTTPENPVTPENQTTPENPVTPEKPTTPEEPNKPEEPTITKYTVTFKVDGRNVSTKEIEKGKKIESIPTTPTKAGYTFKGWYSDSSKITNETTVSKNMTVTGEWDTYTFTVSLINNDKYSPNRLIKAYKNGTAVGITAIYGKYNGNDEYTLGKWNTSLNGVKIVSYEQFSASSNYKVQLNDGTKVFANGN